MLSSLIRQPILTAALAISFWSALVKPALWADYKSASAYSSDTKADSSKEYEIKFPYLNNYCWDRNHNLVNVIVRADTEYGTVFICGLNKVPKNFYIITNSPDGENEEHIFPLQRFSSQRFVGFDSQYHLTYLLTRNYLIVTENGRTLHRSPVHQWRT